ncbi:MAG: polyprenyl diphosphate synthase [Alphaproteobacteria bacterium]|nr:polyprenyl diphosphate synthase [Alphaproteobacteria bacterium]
MFKIFKKKITSNEPRVTSNDAPPAHIAFICDGNRRWAKDRGMSPLMGHRAGVGGFTDLIDFFIARGVTTLTFWIFSTENWNRSKEEIDFLMKLYEEVFDDNHKKAAEKNLRFRIIGRRDRIPKRLMKKSEKLEKDTAENTGGTIVFALDFGGQDEIIRAANDAIEYYRNNPKDTAPLTSADFETFMDTGDLLPIDMVVRTSNENRVSNYLLWKLAYAELFFVPEHWPDYVKSQDSWEKTLAEFRQRTRRFGGGKEKDYSGNKKEKK